MTARSYCFTINNPKDAPAPEEIPNLRYLIYQREKGKSGTEHFQGYLELESPVRLSALKKIKAFSSAHFESRRGTRDQARAYCMKKDDTYLEGPWEFGTWNTSGQGNRTDWDDLKVALKDKKGLDQLTEDYFSKMVMYGNGVIRASSWMRKPRSERTAVFIFYGPPGTGKTTMATQLYPDAYWKSARNKWFDGYNGQDVVIMDEFTGGWFEFDLWKRLGDSSPLQLEVKGGFIQFTAKIVVYISNFHPRQWYPNLFQEHPEQVKALSRRVNLLEHFTEVGVHQEVEDPQDFVENFNYMLF